MVLLSPASHGEAYPRAAEDGVAAYMEKPFTVADLLATCERVGAFGEGGRSAARDRRGAPRRSLHVPAQVLTKEEGWWTDGELVDLGPAGRGWRCPYPLPAVTAVRLSFDVPGGGRLNVSAACSGARAAGRGFAYGLASWTSPRGAAPDRRAGRGLGLKVERARNAPRPPATLELPAQP